MQPMRINFHLISTVSPILNALYVICTPEVRKASIIVALNETADQTYQSMSTKQALLLMHQYLLQKYEKNNVCTKTI